MREMGSTFVVFAAGAVLAIGFGLVRFVGKLDGDNVDMLTTGLTVAVVLLPLTLITAAVAVVVVVLSRRQAAGARTVLDLPAIRLDRPDLDHRRKAADTSFAEARAAKAMMLLEDQGGREKRPAMRPGEWVVTEVDR